MSFKAICTFLYKWEDNYEIIAAIKFHSSWTRGAIIIREIRYDRTGVPGPNLYCQDGKGHLSPLEIAGTAGLQRAREIHIAALRWEEEKEEGGTLNGSGPNCACAFTTPSLPPNKGRSPAGARKRLPPQHQLEAGSHSIITEYCDRCWESLTYHHMPTLSPHWLFLLLPGCCKYLIPSNSSNRHLNLFRSVGPHSHTVYTLQITCFLKYTSPGILELNYGFMEENKLPCVTIFIFYSLYNFYTTFKNSNINRH